DKDEPIIAPIPPLHHQIIYFLSIWSFKTILNTGLFLRKHLTAPPSSQLTPLVKPYPVRPTLKNRIFLPPSLVPNAKYPVYFSIHGGGWAIGSPEIDDGFCSSFCRKNNIIVVSLDYRKSPTYKFPFAVTDTTALVLAVLADSSLPIDGEKISIGGFSAGGNLAFAACQDEELKGKINGLVGFYPVLNSAESRETKEDRRPKGEDVPRDGVAWSAMFVDWGYVPQGQDRRDPLLSPRFAGRDVFPGNVYLVGAEWDML
ncbi:alpha/beta-hydrolase, partial [Mollisia scopiformis]